MESWTSACLATTCPEIGRRKPVPATHRGSASRSRSCRAVATSAGSVTHVTCPHAGVVGNEAAIGTYVPEPRPDRDFVLY